MDVQMHFIVDGRGKSKMIAKERASHVPAIGHEVRFGGEDHERYFKVTRVVWVYDEKECPFERANIGLKEVE